MFDFFQLSDTTDYEYLLNTLGTDLTLNGKTIKGIVTTTELEQNFDDRRISSLQPFKRGDVITYENKPYIIISEENTKRYNKYKGIMRSLPFSIIFNKDCVYSTIQCYIEVEGFSVRSGQILSSARGIVELYTQDNETSRKIKIDDRFIKAGQPFKVTGVDRLSRPGIAIIVANKDTINGATDDMVNEVAGGLSCNVSITNTKPINVVVGDTVQITLSNSKPTNYVSSNPTIAAVSASGLITGVNEGVATITATRTGNEALKDTVSVNVTLPDKFTIETSASRTSLKYDQTSTISNQVSNNGKNVPTAPVTYSLVYADLKTPVPDSIATITKISEREAIVRNVNRGIPETINVKVALNADSAVVKYIGLSLDYYRAPNYTINISSTHTPPNEVAYNETIQLDRTIYNNGELQSEDTVTWSLVGLDQVSPVPETIARMTVTATNQLDVLNVNETGTDANIYVKATLNGSNAATVYYALKVVSKVVIIQKSISIASTTTETPYTGTPATSDMMIYGKTKTYVATVSPATEPVTWKLTSDTGGTTVYGKIQSQTGTSCTILAGDFQTRAGTIKLTATLVSDPTVKKEYLIRVSSYI